MTEVTLAAMNLVNKVNPCASVEPEGSSGPTLIL